MLGRSYGLRRDRIYELWSCFLERVGAQIQGFGSAQLWQGLGELKSRVWAAQLWQALSFFLLTREKEREREREREREINKQV